MISSDKRLAPLHGETRNKPCQTLAHIAVSRYMEETAQAAKPKRCLLVPETLGNSIPQKEAGHDREMPVHLGAATCTNCLTSPDTAVRNKPAARKRADAQQRCSSRLCFPA